MLTEKDVQEKAKISLLSDEVNNKIEKKNIKDEKSKKKNKRYPMEKTVDDSIKKINILLQNEVSAFYYQISFIIQHLDSNEFECLYKKLKQEKEKKEAFFLFMKTFEKIEEVNNFIFISFFLLQFREEMNKNKTEIDINNNSKYFKNDLEEIKNNFVKIKSLISQKRKPEDKIDNILEKINNCDNIQIKKENGNEFDDKEKKE